MVWEIALGIVLGVVLLALIPIALAVLLEAGRVFTVSISALALFLALAAVLVGAPTSFWVEFVCDSGSYESCRTRVSNWIGSDSIASVVIWSGLIVNSGLVVGCFAYFLHRTGDVAESVTLAADWQSRWLPFMAVFLLIELFFVFSQARDTTGLVLVIGLMAALIGGVSEFIAKTHTLADRWQPFLLAYLSVQLYLVLVDEFMPLQVFAGFGAGMVLCGIVAEYISWSNQRPYVYAPIPILVSITLLFGGLFIFAAAP